MRTPSKNGLMKQSGKYKKIIGLTETKMTFLRTEEIGKIEEANKKLTHISLFTGCGGFDIGFSQAGFESRVMVEWSKECCQTLRANWFWEELKKRKNDYEPIWETKEDMKKSINWYHDREPVILEEDITQLSTKRILEAANLKVGEATIVSGGPPCFKGDTLILTKKGLKEIQDIQIGDEVFTHKRRWRRVIEKHKKVARTREVRGQGIVDTITTDKHLFLARRRVREWDRKQKKDVRRFYKPKWVRAEGLQDYYIGQTYPLMENKIEGTKDFWWFIGKYVADGWLVNRKDRGDGQTCRVVISSGHHQVRETEERIRRCFNCTVVKERTATKFHISNVKLGEFLKPAGRGASNKEIPIEWFGMDKAQSIAFLEGYWYGDGTIRKNGDIRSSSTSKKLTIGLSMLFRKTYNRMVSVCKTTPPKTKVIEGRIVNQRPYWVITYPKKNTSGYLVKQFSWGRCRLSESTKRKEVVYDIGVEEDKSYIANNAIVHNCQGFSLAGHRMINDPRNKLFKEFVRVVAEALPKMFIFENVPGLISMKNGDIIKQICEEFANAGYEVQWQILNAADYGVPQHRRRVFIVGKRIDIMRVTEEGRVQLYMGAMPGKIQHPESFRKKHGLIQKGQSTLTNYASAKEPETILELFQQMMNKE